MYNWVVALVHHAFEGADNFSRGGFLDCEFYRQVKVHVILNPFSIYLLLQGRLAALQNQGSLAMLLVKVPRS
jgi:hypothetical protein